MTESLISYHINQFSSSAQLYSLMNAIRYTFRTNFLLTNILKRSTTVELWWISFWRACNIVQAHTKVINDLKTPFTLVHPLLQLVYFQLHTRNSVGGLNSYLPAEQIYVSFCGGWHGNLYICAHILAVEYIYECWYVGAKCLERKVDRNTCLLGIFIENDLLK